MDSLRVLPPDLFSELPSDGRIETAILLKRNGRMLASWARTPVSWEIATIMAATALGSLETMMESLQAPSPPLISIQISGLRLVLKKVESQAVLVLIAKESVPESHLREVAQRLTAKLPPLSNVEAVRRVAPGSNSH